MGFTFSDKNILELEIGGSKFKIEPFSKAVLSGMAEYEKAVKGFNAADPTSYDTVLDVCNAVKVMVNTVLGDETAYDAIFVGREINFLDHMEIVKYLIETILEFRYRRIFGTFPTSIQSGDK